MRVSVDVTNRDIKDGAFVVVQTRTVDVDADSDTQGTLIAAQIVAATIPDDYMIVATRLVV